MNLIKLKLVSFKKNLELQLIFNRVSICGEKECVDV
jgi:hypothetical protein